MPHIDDIIADKAASDGQFAIAYALLQLAQSNDRLRNDLCFGRQTPLQEPGVLEFIGMQLRDIAEAMPSKD